MADLTPAQIDERLQASLWYAIGQIVDEETLKLGVNASPQFIGSLSEMVWGLMQSASEDTAAFARHAGRSTIQTEDVLMLARRSEDLEKVLKAHVKGLQAEKGKEKGTTAGGGGRKKK